MSHILVYEQAQTNDAVSAVFYIINEVEHTE